MQRNVDRAVAAIDAAAARGADIVALPELFNVGYFAFDAYARAAAALDGPTLDRISTAASEHGVAVQAGRIVEDLEESAAAGIETPTEDGLANAAVFFDRDGNRRAVYRKHHLFGYDSAETQLLTAGEALPTVEFEGFTVAMTTCYDLRFPELSRELAEKGVSLVLVPSAWPSPRVEHWKTLPRARGPAVLTPVRPAGFIGVSEVVTAVDRRRFSRRCRQANHRRRAVASGSVTTASVGPLTGATRSDNSRLRLSTFRYSTHSVT